MKKSDTDLIMETLVTILTNQSHLLYEHDYPEAVRRTHTKINILSDRLKEKEKDRQLVEEASELVDC